MTSEEKQTFNKNIARACKAFRINKGWSTGDMAKFIDTSPEMICSFESGKNAQIIYLIGYMCAGFNLPALLREIEKL